MLITVILSFAIAWMNKGLIGRSDRPGRMIMGQIPVVTDTPTDAPWHPRPIFTASEAIERTLAEFTFTPTLMTAKLLSASSVYIGWLGSDSVPELEPSLPLWVVALEAPGLSANDVLPEIPLGPAPFGWVGASDPADGAYAVWEAYGGMLLMKGALDPPSASGGNPYTAQQVHSLVEDTIPIITATSFPTLIPLPLR
ncbi:MAG: hypothetical protein IPL60_08680 [Ardenticatenia bacterium]|nr:hypothetical protein [Ardenticatenia bacterium]